MGIKEDIIRNYNEPETVKKYMITHSKRTNAGEIIKLSVFKIVINILNNYKNKNILDVGCGDGRYCIKLANDNNVVAIDISKLFLKYVEFKVKKLGLEKKIKLLNMDATKLDFDKRHFDIVLCIDLLHHLPEKDCLKILKGIYRVLKNNGILITEFKNKYNPLLAYSYRKFMNSLYKENGFFIKARSYKEFDDILKLAKFKIVESKGSVIPIKKISPAIILKCKKSNL